MLWRIIRRLLARAGGHYIDVEKVGVPETVIIKLEKTP